MSYSWETVYNNNDDDEDDDHGGGGGDDDDNHNKFSQNEHLGEKGRYGDL